MMERPPALRCVIRSVDHVQRYYESIARLLSVAKQKGHPATVKAHIPAGSEAIDLWCHLWAQHGVECERLLGGVCFFSLSAGALQVTPGLPAARPDGLSAGVTFVAMPSGVKPN